MLRPQDTWQASFLVKILPSPNFLKGMGFYPLYLCSLPFTTLADIVTGIAEIIFCTMNGLPEDQIRLLAYRKLVISPVQQLTYLVLALVSPTLISAPVWGSVLFQNTPISNEHTALIGTLFLYSLGVNWYPGHRAREFAFDKLPQIFKDRDFNVFVPPPTPEKAKQTLASSPPIQ